jgi:preprotein translocase subunit SecF
MLELIKNTKIDFLGKRKFAFVFSGILAILGIFAIVQIANGRANLGRRDGGPAKVRKTDRPRQSEKGA